MFDLRPITIATTTFLASACTPMEIPLTADLGAAITAETSGDGTTTVAVSVLTGNAIVNETWSLLASESLVSTWNDVAQRLVEKPLPDFGVYETSFATSDPGAEFHVAFSRDVDDGAPDSVVTLPEAFELASPGDFSRGVDLTITWASSGTEDAMGLSIRGDCIAAVDQVLPDDSGTYVVPAGTIRKPFPEAPDTCDATITVQRTRTGQLDDAFGLSGIAYGAQYRQVVVVSTP